MKDCQSYIAPFVGIAIVIACDYSFCTINYADEFHWIDLALIVVYNILAVMAVWSLMMTLLSDPGYVPKGHDYNKSHLSKTTLALFKFANDN
jgi:hypothetical protein